MISDSLRQLRVIARSLAATPMFSVAVVLTIALGIGGTTAIFTLIDAVMLRPLPVSDPSRLYRVGDGDGGSPEGGPQGRWGFFPFPLYERLKGDAPEFEDMTAFDWGGSSFSVRRQGVSDAARPLRAEYVTGTYFSTLGVGAFHGRVLSAADDRRSAPPVLVMSHHAWQEVYGSDPSIVASSLLVEGQPFTVIGIAAPTFFGETLRGDPPDLWIPLQQEPTIAGAGSLLPQSVSPWLFVIGRLKPDASIAGMDRRLTQTIRQWIQFEAEYPNSWMARIMRELPDQTVSVVPAAAGVGLMKEQYRSSLFTLLSICVVMLVVACANVANLMVARASTRRTQTALRLALGATRRQIIAEALVESVLLAVVGSIAGLIISTAAAQLLIALAFRSAQFVPIATAPSLGVMTFAFGLALATGVAFGAAPAWLATRTDPIDALRGWSRGSADKSSRVRSVLIVVQATLAIVLVVCSTMLARSFANLEQQTFGYATHGRVLVTVDRLPSGRTLPQLLALHREMEQRLASIPGVRGVGLALYNPLTSNWAETVLVAGHPPNARNESGASWNRVSADYLTNLGVATVRGREFANADNETTAPVAVVNEAFVKRFFRPGEDPLGQHFGVEQPENAGTFRIVGVVRDAKFARAGLRQPARPMFFVPLAQHVDYAGDQLKMAEALSHSIQGIVLVTDTPVGTLQPVVARTLADVDPNFAIMSVRTMQQQIDLTFDRERAVAALAESFAIVALVLAGVGIYGVVAYMVGRQTKEIGIRMSLGASPATVIGLVLRGAALRMAVGVGFGLPLAVVAARLMAAQLYDVPFWDPVALSTGVGSLAACALVAALIPACRAAALSPTRALRAE